MIDLHSHILPSIDDGAANISVSLAMAKQAVEHQISVLAATPHFRRGVSWAVIKDQVEQLNLTLQQHNIDLKVIPGAELFVDPDLINCDKEAIPTYNDNGRYCLLEFPMLEIPHYVEQVLFSLKVKGITPVIAHPERYKEIIKDPNIAANWVETGCLIQVNAGSLTGMFGEKIQKTSKLMLEHKMVHLIASDAHSPNRRGLILDQGYKSAVKIIGDEDAWNLVKTTPEAIVAGSSVDIPEVLNYRRRKRFWFF